MAFTKLHPSEARPNGRTAPKGQCKGKTPTNSGHPVKGRGRSAPTKSVTGTSQANLSPSLKGHGRNS